MYALIVQKDKGYELQFKKDLFDDAVSNTEYAANADLLKQSITANWEEVNRDGVLWVAKIV